MNHDRLRFDLTDLAEEVTVVDLRDRSLRTSRRLGLQRAIATSAAAVVLLGAAAGTALAVRPDAGPGPVPAESPTASPSPVPSAPAPSVTPSRPAVPPDTSSPATPTARLGKVVYGPMPTTNLGTVRLWSWKPGDSPDRLLALPWEPAVLSATVSPDGRQVAWVDRDGTLWVSALDGSGKRKVREQTDSMCQTTWSPDSRHLTAAVAGEGAGLVDVVSGAYQKVDGLLGCHPVWAANGTLALADGGDGTVFLTDRRGSARRVIPGLGGEGSAYVCYDLASISPDGRHIALFRIARGNEGGDAARSLLANVVLDTRTGKEVVLPLGDRELRQVFFQADGSMVVRVRSGDRYTLLLVGEDGKKVAEQAEPPSLRDMQIINALG
ncbi:WD40 repeat domain-containing protein [Micromonospora sp. CV4]|uniref:WD40 repeat domain-containing protein n=1 Tax=Micromonospora sp. CV4 TaxID=2478711 RepID=UPI000EF51177|nr:WD40 repeat domain-containing protein [Micromonospora sp. CV4]RLP95888.1 hypothetical protein EAD98_12395 [Micromonospora sp. CV4]